jgi:ribonuclease BN (tRNA processing enzyme)
MSSLLFLGTAGGRVLVFRQLRASGGLWFEANGTNILIDPGPGSLIRCLQHNLNPQELDAIILTHKHLDHSADANVIIEAVSEGGLKPKGILLAPGDCYDIDPVVLEYNRNYLDKFLRITEGFKFELNGICIEFPVRHEHGVETYGLRITTDKVKFSHIVDTKYFDGLITSYNDCDILMMNMVFSEPRPFPHLSYDDVLKLVDGIKPKLAIITHFGYNLWKLDVDVYAKKIEETTGVETVAAKDGMKLNLEEQTITNQNSG